MISLLLALGEERSQLPHAAQAGPPRIPSSDSFPEGPAFKSAGPLSDHATVSLLLGGGVCIRLADIRKPTLLDFS